jgi:tellurite resistance protein TerC
MFAAAFTGSTTFVDLAVPVWAWLALGASIVAMLAIDLYRHRDDHAPTPREALVESATWVACAFAFGGIVAITFGANAFGEYISGYLIEKSLSVDNVFVWSMLFSAMAVPLKYQHRVLYWGVFGALSLRAAFVLIGGALISKFWWLLLVFGVFLIYTGIKVIRHRSDEGTQQATHGRGLLSRIMVISDDYDGHRFLTRVNGRRAATPLLAALVVIELTDIIFAVDSVPAILAVSHEPFIVLSSNAFAILGLRAMYFLLANAKERFHYLSHALGGILIFVGIKMAVARWFHLDTYVSLGIIVSLLIAAIVFSNAYASNHGTGT